MRPQGGTAPVVRRAESPDALRATEEGYAVYWTVAARREPGLCLPGQHPGDLGSAAVKIRVIYLA
jgi:hypothetical protein